MSKISRVVDAVYDEMTETIIQEGSFKYLLCGCIAVADGEYLDTYTPYSSTQEWSRCGSGSTTCEIGELASAIRDGDTDDMVETLKGVRAIWPDLAFPKTEKAIDAFKAEQKESNRD